MTEIVEEESLLTLGGRVRCKRCQAKAKRTQLQCLLPAVTGKRVCRVHGGLSRGPVTKEAECAAVLQSSFTDAKLDKFAMNVVKSLPSCGYLPK